MRQLGKMVAVVKRELSLVHWQRRQTGKGMVLAIVYRQYVAIIGLGSNR